MGRIRRNKKNRPQAAILDLKADGSVPPAGLVAVVAEEQAVIVDEVSDRSDVAVAVHDGELGLRQLPDERQCGFILEVYLSADDSGEVVGNENGCVAVALVVRIGGQANDPIVCDAAAAGQVECPHHPRLI